MHGKRVADSRIRPIVEQLEPRLLLDGTTFGPYQDLSFSTSGAESVYAADLDGDGDADILSASSGDDKIAWYENLGGGSFSIQKVISTAANGANSVYATDLDGDGDADVLSASSSWGDSKIAWYENLGGGSFSTQKVIGTGAPGGTGAGGFLSVYATDLDGDGDADVLSASYDDDKIAWYENLGGGTFSAEKVISTAADAVRSVYATDLDGDGDADVLSASQADHTIGWYENLGSGNFSAQKVISSEAEYATSVYATDLDGDGDADVLSASESEIEWYENLGGGSFSAEKTISTEGRWVMSVYATDLDGDADADVLSASLYDDEIAWYENLGGGSFSAQKVISTAADWALSVYATDLDGDGDADVLSASRDDDKIAWYENLGGGSFSAQKVISTAASFPQSVYAADLDGDGDADVLSASRDDDVIAWYENLGGGSFSAQKVISTPTYWALSVYAADLDGDGDADVLSASEWGDRIAWYENLGGGSFSAQKIITTAADGPYSVYATDLDGDGDADVLSASGLDDKIAWYENLGGGSFSAQKIITTATDGARSVYATDLDGDGDADVLSASENDGKIAWYENLGAGSFSAQKIISTAGLEAQSVYATDLDGDGDADVLSASWGEYEEGRLAWYENLGGGSFSAQKVIGTVVSASGGRLSVYATDLDGDGDVDVLVANYSVAWFENLGGGSFSTEKALSMYAYDITSVYATDLDGDGDADVLSGSVDDQNYTIAWYENLGGGSFSPPKDLFFRGNGDTASVYATDLDGDGDVDVLSSGGHDVAWYENLGGGSFSDQKIIPVHSGDFSSVYATDLDGDGDADVLSAGDHKIAWNENLLELYDRYDLNRDGTVDGGDIDELYGHFAGAGQADLRYDLDGDRDADHDDVAVLLQDGLHTVFGDANVDGTADGLDYIVWSTNYQQSGGWADGDFTGDGYVDGLDYIAWSNNYDPVVPAVEQKVATTAAAQVPESGPVEEQAVELFSVSPALFVENQGQWADESVHYAFQGDGTNVLFTDAGPIFQVFKREPTDEAAAADTPPASDPFQSDLPGEEDYITQSLQFSVHFDGANAASPTGLGQAETYFNYFIGDQADWRSNVPAYETVAYEGLYDGIDLHTWGRRDSLKYEFYIAPGADYGQIQVSYEGIEGLWMDAEGALHVQTALGELIDDAPYIYQVIDGEQVEVPGVFELVDGDTYVFDITAAYDPTRQLVIDPYLSWSTYLGGPGDDSGSDVAADGAGGVYVTGSTSSAGWVSGGFDTSHNGSFDAFVARFSSAGVHLWSTYLGGAEWDYGRGIAADGAEGVYVTGRTHSDGWASGGFDTSHNGYYDGFVAKLSSAGGHLWSTYLGGGAYDEGRGITVDGAGGVYVTGETVCVGWVSGGFDTTYNGSTDGFVAKLSSDGGHLWSTYLGGAEWDYGTDVAADGAGGVYVTGRSYSDGWASGGFDISHNGSDDAFVARLSSDGGHLWSTYLGGSGRDYGRGVAADAAGGVYVTGRTKSAGWVSGGFDTSHDGGDAFVARLSSAGGHLWSTYLGGGTAGASVAADGAGGVYVTGSTSSVAWVSGGFDTSYNGGAEGFVARLSSAGGHLWSSFLGGSNAEYVSAVAADGAGGVYVAGTTHSSDWISGGFDTSYGGNGDAFVLRVRPIMGDASDDGIVDGLDYLVWFTNYHQSGGWGDGDFTGDGYVDGLDYVAWSNNYDPVIPAVASAGMVGDAVEQKVATTAAAQLPESELVGEAGRGAIPRSSAAPLRPGAAAGLGGWASHAAGAPSDSDMAVGQEDGRDVPAWPVSRLRAIAPAGVPEEVEQVLLTDTGAAGMRSPAPGLAALEDDLVDILGLVQLRAPLQS